MKAPIKHKVIVLERFVSPFFWNEFRGKKYILDSDERIILEKKIEIENDPKEKMIVFGSWEPYAVSFKDHHEYEVYKEGQRVKAIQERKEFYENLRKEAKVFNEGLNFPVNWASEIKEVLSGLSANSNGDGQKRNTVRHIYLLEDLSHGRLHRKSGNFLCSPVKSKRFGDWSGSLGSDEKEEFKVTCKTCLKIAKRFKDER